MLSMERFCESRQLRNKLLNIHYVGGNGGEFFATMMQNHSEFNFHDGCYNDPKAIKYEFKRDEFDNLSQYYLGWGIDNDCLTNYSPKEFFEMWKTSPDKWTIRVDHGYGYNTQTEEWRKGLYTDWNVSKTIILNCTEIKGAEYCRGLCYHKVFGKEYYEVITKKGDTPIIKSCAISIIRDRLFKYHGDFIDFWENPLNFNQRYTKNYIDLIPEGYDYLEVDPMKLLHTRDDVEREEQLIRIFDYLELDYRTLDECMLLCEKYMKDNRNKYNNGIQRS